MKNILNIIKIAKPLYGLVAIIALLIVITAGLELIAPIFSKFIVDEIVTQIQIKQGNLQKLVRLIAVAFSASLLSIILTGISERLGDHFGGKLRKFLTEKFYDKVLTLPQSYFDGEISGKIVNQLNRAITSIQQFINASTNFILPMFLQSIFTIAVLAYYNLQIATFTFILFPIYFAISYYSAKKWGEYEIRKNRIEDLSRGRIQEVIGNIKLVKSSLAEANEYNFVSQKLSSINKIYARQSTIFHLFDFSRNLSLILILLIINIVAFYSTFLGNITLGTLVLIIQLVNQARRPLFAMSFILTNIQNAESGSKEYFEILDLKSSENFKKTSKTNKLKRAAIEFKNVSFKYEKSDAVLKDVSFKINEREKIALVGPSGTGKTTIVNLLLKFYKPSKGEIFLTEKAYEKLTANFVRDNIALVFQESELFSSTVYENVAYGIAKVNRKIVIDALKEANSWDFVRKLPAGINSEIGERGVRLSGGQKQRVQIARAILKDAPILILDEATSSLDAKSEKEVQIALENLMKNKLVIIIAHRFSTIQNVDRVIVLDEGRIADSGTPGALAKKPGIYSDLLKFQIEGNKKLLEKFEIY